MKADFSGYATKSGLVCTDGRIIHADAFKEQDTQKVPLVWQHQHDGPVNILGYSILEHRADGTYIQGFFNESESGKNAKTLVQHGDISALSIYANRLKHVGNKVVHGLITEVSLVLAGANPGAFIDNVNLAHAEDGSEETEAIIYTGLDLEHSLAEDELSVDEAERQKTFDTLSDEQKTVVMHMLDAALNSDADDADDADDENDDDENDDENDETIEHSGMDDDARAIFNTLNEAQLNVVAFMIAEALEEGTDSTDSTDSTNSKIQHSQEGTTIMTNVFDKSIDETKPKRTVLSHSQIQTLVQDGIKMGSFKESYLAHAEDYGITNIDLMFPDAKALSTSPELIARQADWVPKVLGAVKSSPFAKIKSLVADLTAAEARAKGYITGTLKKEEVISLLRRTTGPTTIYKKQKLDRDDILDITDFDVIAWLKWEIRFMLNEELARAILVGDGRSTLSEDKIKDPAGAVDGTGIRSILHDNDLYSVKVNLVANIAPSEVIDEVTRSRTQYRGSGSPSYYTTDAALTDLLLLKDKMGRRLYETEASLASALRVKEIVPVEVMNEYPNVLGILVNLIDYTIGANKGGELTFFEDFDIDFNQNKYLLETRVSGALTKPKSAVVILREQGTLVASITAPSFDGPTNVITVPTTTGVDYLINDTIVTNNVTITQDTEIVAEAKTGYYFPSNITTTWAFTFTD